MQLKRQLLLVSLLFLALPWAGCQLVREVESALRQGQEQRLQATAAAVANVLRADHTVMALLRRDSNLFATDGDQSIVFEPARVPVVVDGYVDEDWEDNVRRRLQASESPHQFVHYRAINRDGRLYLFFEVRDRDINYFNPGKPEASDKLVLLLGGESNAVTRTQAKKYVITSSSPGRVAVRQAENGVLGRVEPAINAYWQDTVGGYNIELSVPLTLSQGRIGFYRFDTNRDIGQIEYGTVRSSSKVAPRAIYSTANLREQLIAFEQPGLKLGIVDRDGIVVSEHGSLRQTNNKESYWALRSLYSSVLSLPTAAYKENSRKSPSQRAEIVAALSGTPEHKWYRGQAYSNRSILSAAAPLTEQEQGVSGVLYAEQSSEQFLALTDSAFTRIFTISFAALAFAALGLLAFASLLSLRIRRLSQAAERAIADDGSVRTDFPNTRAGDEIGDLSRSYASMVLRVREYTEYLQSLSGKLSHELRTPLAVVHTSLDNLERETLDESAEIYLQRAKDGAAQLSHILTAMSEATRVEESIASSERERCDLLSFLEEISGAYADTFKQHKVEFVNNTSHKQLHLTLAPELLAQMLDKLLENAADFATAGSAITIAYEEDDLNHIICVSNEGQLLSDAMQSQVFQKMVSVRESNNRDVHLGLGLYIVKLIAEFHSGTVDADNISNPDGVRFRVLLPRLAVEDSEPAD